MSGRVIYTGKWETSLDEDGLRSYFANVDNKDELTVAEFTSGTVTHYTGFDRYEVEYFGARYLDPMLGMWTSVDPARQFASPYLYAGNGVNPINGVDPDGKVFNPVGTTIGVVLGVRNSWNAQEAYWANGGDSELEAMDVGLIAYGLSVLGGAFSIEGGLAKTVFTAGIVSGGSAGLLKAAEQGLSGNSADAINVDEVAETFSRSFVSGAMGALIGVGITGALGGSMPGENTMGDVIGSGTGAFV